MADMTRRSVLGAALAGAGLMLAKDAKGNATPAQAAGKPQRVKKAIELLSQGQPVYYTMATGGHKEGRALAKTWADIIIYDMEHGGPLNLPGLQDFMQGLVDGGPTKSGHRTPAVIPQLPVGGLSESIARANYWMFFQLLDMGVHGIHLCHAREPGAVRAMVQSSRYPFDHTGSGIGDGLRGSGGQSHGAYIWGMPVDEYLRKADPWPLNPEGELLLGIKVEDKYALANTEESTAVPGIGFCEWGPGDMGMSLGFIDHRQGTPYPAEMQQARARVLTSAKVNHLFFLNSVNVNNIEAMIKEGVMIGAGNEAAAEKGRRFTHRTMPW
jgi:4-hydroxy-2-oxoheptanedioate aldolase